MKKLFSILMLLILFGALARADKLPVTASFSILGDITEQVGGQRVAVTTIVGANQDAHVYQVTPTDLKKIQSSRLFVMNGYGLEGASLRRATTQSQVAIMNAAMGLLPLKTEEGYDPHLFNNPILVKKYAWNIAIALICVDPEGADYYIQRLNDYWKQLDKLNNWAVQTMDRIPQDKRKVLTAHDAFAYLGHQYEIEFIAPQGVSTEAEASAKTVAMMIKQVKEQQIKAIFAENIKDPRLINQISRETGAKVVGELYADALSNKNGEAGTYIEMIRFNIGQLSQAMQ